ncbi:hypothetical protein [Saccharopolyspora tripterygii]
MRLRPEAAVDGPATRPCRRGPGGFRSWLYAELFGARVRYTGFASSREIGAALDGLSPLAASPLVASALVASALVIQGGGTGWPVVVWMIFTALVSLVAFALSRETRDTDVAAPDTER